MVGLAGIVQKCWPEPVREAPMGTKSTGRWYIDEWHTPSYGDLGVKTFYFCFPVYCQADMSRRKSCVPYCN
jgi:hypothetical protein